MKRGILNTISSSSQTGRSLLSHYSIIWTFEDIKEKNVILPFIIKASRLIRNDELSIILDWCDKNITKNTEMTWGFLNYGLRHCIKFRYETDRIMFLMRFSGL